MGRRFLCSSDAHSMLGNELSTLGAGHVAARAAVAAASSSGHRRTDDRNVAWCTLRCPTVDGEGQYELGIDARCATASPASPASAFDTPPCTPSHACQSLKPSRLFDRMLAGDAGSWTIQLVHLELAWNLPYFGASALRLYLGLSRRLCCSRSRPAFSACREVLHVFYRTRPGHQG